MDEHRGTIALGPGIGTNAATIEALEKFLINSKAPCLLDADALNCLAERRNLLNSLPIMSVLTPHAREFERLFGEYYTEEDRLKKALEVARYYNIVLVLKGHYTKTVFPDGKIYVNHSGNAGMATAGSGDVLTGVISSLMAQGYRPEVAAVLGVFLHGYAGDLAAAQLGSYSLTAPDIIDYLPKAIIATMANK